ncbi:MAG TPA: TonB family protein [Pyrinomonadaceae bacterium]|jgi:TonB family protein
MKMRLVFSIFVFALFSANIFSQTGAQKTAPTLKDGTRGESPENFTVGDVKGTVEGKAVYLAKPVYPIEARQAGAEGEVKVQITIDEQGNVSAATAVSGHQLLRAAAEDAARRTKFRPVRGGSGQTVKTNGILVYNFAFQKSNWIKIGYDLAILEKIPTLLHFPAPQIAKAFAPEWTNELYLLEKLAEMRRSELEKQPEMPTDEPPVIKENTGKLPNGTVVGSMTLEKRLLIPNPPTPERISIAQNLISALQARLGNDETSFWQFNLGVELSRALQLARNPGERANAAQILRERAKNAPASISPEVIAALENLAAIFENQARTMRSENEIGKSLSIIFSAK